MQNYFHSLYAVLLVVTVVPVTEFVFFMISLSAAKRAASSLYGNDVVRSTASSGAINNAAGRCSMWK